MYTSMDAVGPGVAPVRNDYSPAAFYFLIWVFYGR